MINFEGGAVPEEYLNEYVIDRVETTSTTWLGLTMGCARCHSHKFDPLSQKEFYQFYAFFNSIAEQGLDGNTGNARPYLALPSDAQKAQQDALTEALSDHQAALSDKNISPLQEVWEQGLQGKLAVAPLKGLLAHYDFDGSLSDSSGRYQHGRTVKGDPTFGAGMVSRAVNLDSQTELRFGNVGAFERDQPFTLAVWLRPSLSKPDTIVLQKISDESARRGYELLIENTRLIDIQRYAGQLTLRLTAQWPQNALQVRTRGLLNNGDWRHVAITYDGSGKAAGVQIYFNGERQELDVLQDNLNASLKNDAELMLGGKIAGKAYGGGLDDLRLYERALTAAEVEQLAVHYPIQTILSGVSGKRTKEENDRLRDYFLTRIATASLQQQYAELKELRKRKAVFDKTIASTMTMMELGKPRDSFVLARGDYRNHTDKVTPGVPAVLPPLPNGAKATRLALAQWLVDPQHPLTARVAVNRYWQMFFGLGLVKTVEDFGAQGEPPVNQELLDWLALEFMQGGNTKSSSSQAWGWKRMHKLMVMSNTYRQSSQFNEQAAAKDSENRLLWRMNPRRLEAEAIRDSMLVVSNKLNKKMYGPGVYPRIDPDIVNTGSRPRWPLDAKDDDETFRRSIYIFVKRSVLLPLVEVFDCPVTVVSAPNRATSTVSPQALALMNNEFVLEQAKFFAERVTAEAGTDVNAQIVRAFQIALNRKPSAKEQDWAASFLKTQTAGYAERKNANPSAAALRDFCHAIMNLNEFLYVD